MVRDIDSDHLRRRAHVRSILADQSRWLGRLDHRDRTGRFSPEHPPHIVVISTDCDTLRSSP